ncbi:MAG: response regulator [Candidatus Omnitrophica bacterium]|nr:response regulator [Candidatus Omnitrophota bacterium]
MAKKRILIIDDDEGYGHIVKVNLEKTGKYEVRLESHSDRALSSAVKLKPDLILLDMIMPKLNGLEVLDVIKKDERTLFIPVIMLTSIDSRDLRGETFSKYAEDFIAKPVNSRELEDKIDSAMSRLGKLDERSTI